MKYELNTLYNMDCMAAMKDIPDGYFELAIVDPPYGGGAADDNESGGRLVKEEALPFRRYL